MGFIDMGGSPAYFNRYSYVGIDPVNMLDPDGRCSTAFGSYGMTCIAKDAYETVPEQCARDVRNASMAGVAAASIFVPGPEDVVLGVAAVRLFSTRAVLRLVGSQLRAGNTLVLYSGKVPALQEGEFTFRVPSIFWSKGVNEKVLKAVIRSRATVRDSHVDEAGKLIDAKPGSVLAAESEALQKSGYKFNEDSGNWEPPKIAARERGFVAIDLSELKQIIVTIK